MERFNIGILGAGHIAGKMVRTLQQVPQVKVLAVASRSAEKAQAFASEFGIPRAYGSYGEMLQDGEVELVYVATPNSCHYEHGRMCLLADKPVLMEKSFTVNAQEAAELIRLSQERKVFLGEAIWTRYMPISLQLKKLLDEGAIGQPLLMNASLSYNVIHKERVLKPELGGGALLDLGLYLLNFARMYFGTDYGKVVSACQMGPSGVDLQESITLLYPDGKMANLLTGVVNRIDRQATIGGTEGYVRIDNVNNPTRIEVYQNFDLIATYERPENCITGYEYEVLEAMRCIRAGEIETPMMPHAEILAIMQQMDDLLAEWKQ